MTLFCPARVELKETKKKIHNKSTYEGWKIFYKAISGFMSPLHHTGGAIPYKLNEIIEDKSDYHIHYLRSPGYHTAGFFIFPAYTNAIQASRIAWYLPRDIVLCKVRFTDVVTTGLDECTQPCVVARTMVIDKVWPWPKNLSVIKSSYGSSVLDIIHNNELPLRSGKKTLVRRHKDGHLVFHPSILEPRNVPVLKT